MATIGDSVHETGSAKLVVEDFANQTTRKQTNLKTNKGDEFVFGIDPTGPCGNIFLERKFVNECQPGKHLCAKVSILRKTGEKLTKEFITFHSFKSSSYSSKWIPRKEILDPAYRAMLPNGTLTLLCEIQVLEPQVEEKPTRMNNIKTTELPKVLSDLQALLKSGKHSDVILHVGGKEFPAHKLILSIRSPVFYAMFEHDSKEIRHVGIPDIGAQVFEQLLQFIYVGEVDQDSLDQCAAGLFEASDKYQLTTLKAICEQYMAENLTPDTACQILVFADQHQAPILKSQAIKYIIEHKKEVISTDGWNRLVSADLLKELFLAH